MNAKTRMSAKGQVVIPKDVRDRLRLQAGEVLEVVETANGVMLRRISDRPRISHDEFERRLAPIRALYKGPPVSIEDMNMGIDQALHERAKRKGW